MISRREFIRQTSVIAAGSQLPGIIVRPKQRKLGVALVGLGYYSTDLLAPALQMTEFCELRGIVTGSPGKIPLWQSQYGIPDGNVYDYDSMHSIADNKDIDVVYVVLPTSMHMAYSILAAEAGKHVWCEKPMARTAEECSRIIQACKRNKVSLSVGYRMHHEPNTRTIMEYGRTRPFGDILTVRAEAGYYDGRTDHWKQKKAMGGGALYDMGVYPINAVRYATQAEPLAVVSARHTTNRPEVYHEVDETTIFQLEFPDGVTADCWTSFGGSRNILHVECANGWYNLQPFQSYSGIRGQTSSGVYLDKTIPNQQARQMVNDALAIINNTDPIVPGEEGLRDIRIVEAV